jgi:hypothetical protein
MRYNLDYLPAEEFDLMNDDELNEYLDAKAKWIREQYVIRPLTNYHKKLARMVSGIEEEKINQTKSN